MFAAVTINECPRFIPRRRSPPQTRLICVAVIDNTDDAVPLAEALLAGGLNVIEVTFRTAAAAEAIALIRRALPEMRIGCGTVLTTDQARQAADAGAQFGVSPGLNETVLLEARALKLPFFPGVMTPRRWTAP